jgi:hypothetical protein
MTDAENFKRNIFYKTFDLVISQIGKRLEDTIEL